MSEQKPPEQENRGGLVLTVVSRLLDYMKTPWQALAIMGLLLLTGAGWLIWTERAEFISLLHRKPAGPVVLKSDVLPELNGLLNDTTADVISFWRVDFNTNTQTYLLSTKRGGGIWPKGDGHMPALTQSSNMKRVVKLLNGQSVCGAANDDSVNLLLRKLAQDNYHWVCVVPVPPDPNSMTLGLIYMGWTQKPDDSSQTAARTIATALAGNMTTSNK